MSCSRSATRSLHRSQSRRRSSIIQRTSQIRGRRSCSFPASQKILLIGSGLTAADVINAASSDPQRTPTLHALSRHGLVPPRQTAFRPDAFKGDGNALILAASTSLRGLTKSVRLLAREAESVGGDWREAITFVRNMAPTIWQRLSEHDRVRFLRHLRALWDVHRHRLPSAADPAHRRVAQDAALARSCRSAAAILRTADGRIEVTWRRRGTRSEHTEVFDRVVNCTGPDYAIARSTEPLWRNLVQCGLCVSDPLGLGLRTGPTRRGDRRRWLARPAPLLCRADAARRPVGSHCSQRVARTCRATSRRCWPPNAADFECQERNLYTADPRASRTGHNRCLECPQLDPLDDHG